MIVTCYLNLFSKYTIDDIHMPYINQLTCSILKLAGEDRRWMETALIVSIHYGILDLLRYLVDTQGVTLIGELFNYLVAVSFTLTLGWSLTLEGPSIGCRGR